MADLAQLRALSVQESGLAVWIARSVDGSPYALTHTRGVWVGRFGLAPVNLRAHRAMWKAVYSGWKRCLDLLAAHGVTTRRIEQV